MLQNLPKMVRLTHVQSISQKDLAQIKFSVIDTGIGIPESNLKDLFKSFSQVDSSLTRVYEGTGLGLAISKKLTELMGGTIAVKSKYNEGSTFYFTIPF
ncbi:hypothetical protein KHA80_18620 [Anaerobacillus sp. HL2]|nr:hypothetical protein KHA80_18620 [Anaerobacillus sp. HL2]